MQLQFLLTTSILAVWLLVISFFVFRFYYFFNKLTKGVGVGDLKVLLEKVVLKEKDNSLKISEAVKRVIALEEGGRGHVQKVGLVRFNPFKELGGDHSFSLAILNGVDTGIIITSLHTRDRTRVYMKEVKAGKSSFDLSTEEKKALVSAQKG